MKTIQREIVSGLIFSKDGKLLMGMKDPKHGGVYPDCWHIPGGGVETDETKEQALQREILEETGIDISSAKVSLADDQGSGQTEKVLKETGERVLCTMRFNVYRIDLDTSAEETPLNPSDDLPTLEWALLAKLGDYTLTPPSISLFKRIGIV
ncbi:MAG TPA: NUDIX hydrolase [Candidatus Saccharimonadales bacterium]|nr:NUDIX hydrolase [Candidatus Saccharimonadales bacterium]